MRNKWILLVDDDEGLVSTFKTIIEAEGYHIDVATTGREALEKCEDTVFDLVILDFMLPDMRGMRL